MVKNKCINAFKGIACELVVINHFFGVGLLGSIEYTISHIAVPYFFLVSGFYLCEDNMQLSLKKMLEKAKHISILTAIHLFIYFINNCFIRYVLNGNTFIVSSVFDDIKRIFTIPVLKSTLVWGTTILGEGQWFLFALIQVYFTFIIVILLHIEKLILKHSELIAAVLFFIHIFVRLYIFKIGIISIGAMSVSATPIVRNAWFDGLPFVLLGMSIRKREFCISMPKYLLYIGFSGLALSIYETFLVTNFAQPDEINCVLYLGTIVSVTAFFTYAVVRPQCRVNYLFEYIGEKLSMKIYFLHPLVGYYTILLLQNMGGINSTIALNLVPLVIILLVTIISFLIHFLIARVKKYCV